MLLPFKKGLFLFNLNPYRLYVFYIVSFIFYFVQHNRSQCPMWWFTDFPFCILFCNLWRAGSVIIIYIFFYKVTRDLTVLPAVNCIQFKMTTEKFTHLWRMLTKTIWCCFERLVLFNSLSKQIFHLYQRIRKFWTSTPSRGSWWFFFIPEIFFVFSLAAKCRRAAKFWWTFLDSTKKATRLRLGVKHFAYYSFSKRTQFSGVLQKNLSLMEVKAFWIRHRFLCGNSR